MLTRFRQLAAVLITASGPALAGEAGRVVLDDKAPVASHNLCDLFDRAVLYEDKDDLAFQKFALTGRLQADAAFYEADQGNYDRLEWRRFRSGFKSQHFDHFTLHAEAELDLVDSDPLYNKLTDSYVGWSKSDALEIKIGKQGAPFTMDGATSSKSLIRMERSLLSNNLWFPEEYFTGATAAGEVGNWVYTVGVFSSDGGPEFGDFEAGYFGLFSVGYDFAETLAADTALVRVDYVNNDPTGNGVLNTRNLTDIVSLNATLERGQWGLRSEVAAGSGFGSQSDITALAIMPYFTINDQWQLVASYNRVASEDLNGVRLDRYENRIESGRVDEAHEFYFGVNRYFCEHQLKWQTGVEYTTTEDAADDGGAYDGWGLSSGIRISW
jgi:phosphate-selective porin OprO/OprP